MQRVAFLLGVVGVILQAFPLTANSSQATQNPFVGSWTANLSRSKLDPRSEFQGATLQISVAGDTATLASEVVNASGQKQSGAETFRTDGIETPGTLTPGVSHVARWVGSHVLAAIAKKGGQVVFLITYQVSADGKSLTSRSSGMVEQVVVFDRNE